MEPTPPEIAYVIFASVRGIRELQGNWYAIFEGSQEWICVGNEKPNFDLGDPVKITIQRIPTKCPPSQTTNPTNSPSS